MTDDAGQTKELRLALVLYGGVSLAIYMHGITKELHKLVAASRALDVKKENPFADGTTEHVYFEALEHLRDKTHVRTEVVVDIVSGTSAGGINGVYLAKALGRNVRQDELSTLWLEKGDIALLVRGGPVLRLVKNWKLRLFRNLRECLRKPHENIAPLRGDVMCRWYLEALDNMDRAAKYVAGLDTLMPDGHDLQLFVTVTDAYGYNREIPITSPPIVTDARHRHVLEFRRDSRGTDHFDGKLNDGLAFASRATSSFPGAFPAVRFADFEACFQPKHDLAAFDREFCRAYALAGASARDTYFIDGGVLDNYPFDHAVGAIRRRPATVEVDRRLLYVQPDPVDPKQPPGPRTPGLLTTVAKGLTIPGHEPILDQLNELMTFNDRVRAIRDIIEVGFGDVRDRVEKLLAGSPGTSAPLAAPAAADAARRTITGAAHADASSSPGYGTYVRVKVQAVVDGFAGIVSTLLEFPADSNHAFFVRSVFRQWARDADLFTPDGTPTQAQKDFLRAFDVDYERRLLRFLIAAVGWWYRPASGGEQPPTRAQLDEAKTTLYSAVARLDDLLAGRTVSEELKKQVAGVFTDAGVREAIGKNGFDAGPFLKGHGAELAAIRDAARVHIAQALDAARAILNQQLAAVAKDWPGAARRDVEVRYFGFPFWDMMLYPVEALADAGERDAVEVVRVSPLDSTLLKPPGATKLEGVSMHHFGAFLHPEARANDYLWGRLDAVERLLGLVLGEQDDDLARRCADGFRAVLAEERELAHVDDVRTAVSRQLATIGS